MTLQMMCSVESMNNTSLTHPYDSLVYSLCKMVLYLEVYTNYSTTMAVMCFNYST